MATDLLATSTRRNFDIIKRARVEFSGVKLVLRLELSRSISPEWLKRLTVSLLTEKKAIRCFLEWVDTDGSMVTAVLTTLDGAVPSVGASHGPFVDVDHVVLVWGSSTRTKKNETSLSALRRRDTLPDIDG